MSPDNTPHNNRDQNRDGESKTEGVGSRGANPSRDTENQALPSRGVRYDDHQTAQEFLKQQLHELVAQQFCRWGGLRDEQVYRHIAGILLVNIREDFLDEAVGPVETHGPTGEHRFVQAQRLSRIIDCCFDFERGRGDARSLGELFSFLGDQVVFLKGMFHPQNIDVALDLSASKLPAEVHTLPDLAAVAYGRASELVADGDDVVQAQRKSALFERLSENVVDCIRGLQRVRMELNFQAYGLGVARPNLFLFGGH